LVFFLQLFGDKWWDALAVTQSIALTPTSVLTSSFIYLHWTPEASGTAPFTSDLQISAAGTVRRVMI